MYTPEQRAIRYAYTKEWIRKNKEKVRLHRVTFWKRLKSDPERLKKWNEKQCNRQKRRLENYRYEAAFRLRVTAYLLRSAKARSVKRKAKLMALKQDAQAYKLYCRKMAARSRDYYYCHRDAMNMMKRLKNSQDTETLSDAYIKNVLRFREATPDLIAAKREILRVKRVLR